ncbi:DUF512 domain-containing protein [Alkaliphilus serpentinus]|uniref:DUF512 domain-containing protein n=1 Tax=Alkaliphilus serpentinus TaxID=1482731 RepID=A0A833HRG7_9FIRM|nr:DUF512 domain-containing protein [Alkaliphilus serpentinus]KAB3533166.1 DUF512 domain-containing protein [Alkaliphilus serpentinus]
MKEISGKNVISHIEAGSIAEELGLEVGDILLSINGNQIEDIIEYKFYIADEYLEVAIEKSNGEEWVLEIEKDYDENLGIDFENPLLTHMRSCQNKCIFCFIDQLPPNMRESLYFKDDDSRMSFLHGNYITLTNMKEEDINKIIKYRITPINVSVHTTNGELRKKILNNKFASNILELLTLLADNDIEMNCQIVLCPDFNDGAELDRTLKDLGKLSYSINSVAAVPVGLTRFREELTELRAYDKASAQGVIRQIEGWQKKFQNKIDSSFVYLSDEFYILAEVDIPAYEAYEGFPQLENGVGMLRKFRDEAMEALNKAEDILSKEKRITIVTGNLACDYMKSISQEINHKISMLTTEVVCVNNHYFGGQVSVSGLLTGVDILNTLRTLQLGDEIFIGENLLKSGEEVFLDDMTVSELETALNTTIRVVPVDGEAFINRLYN